MSIRVFNVMVSIIVDQHIPEYPLTTTVYNIQLTKVLNNYYSKTSRSNFNFYILKYSKKYSVSKYEVKNCHSK